MTFGMYQKNNPFIQLYCRPKGKFLYDFNIIQSGEDFLIQCNKNDIDDLITRLTIYKLRSDIVFVKKGWGITLFIYQCR